MAANVWPTITTMQDLNVECLHKIFLNIDIGERIKLRTVSKKFRDAVDACWAEVRAVGIFYPRGAEDSKKKTRSIRGIHPMVIMKTSNMGLIEEVLKRCGDTITELVEERHLQEKNSILPLAIKYCSSIEILKTAVVFKRDDKIISQLLDKIPKLKGLELRINFKDTKLCFGKIPTDHLEQLMFATWECRNPSDEILNGQKEVLTRCSSSLLKHFSSDFFDNELLEICGTKINLKILEMRFIHPRGVTESGLSPIWGLTNLRTLILSALPKIYRGDDRRFLPPVTDDFLIKISKKLPLLEWILIEAPRKVTGEGFMSLSSLEKLEKLTITECNGITNDDLSFPFGLKELNLMACRRISNRGVIELLEEAENLEFLNLDYTQVSNKLLKAAVTLTKKRTNGIHLKLSVFGTHASPGKLKETSPLLEIID